MRPNSSCDSFRNSASMVIGMAGLVRQKNYLTEK
jgi:hypothetical protein